jgi:hypothetical protein
MLKRAIFLCLVRLDLRFDLVRFDAWALFMEHASVLWPDFDGEGTGGESFWQAIR